ncbi:MAG: prepilin-type cleavage/methylation domain-containing protein [Gammaproteobacteria bacterium]|nr:prepilin-type cleavage/methylation domain-containing protein [Gammaproteobacteria bacterium]
MDINGLPAPIYKILGVTLIELLIVVAILATLTGLGITGYSSYRDTAYINTTKQEIVEIAALIDRYKLATGNWPGSLSDVKQQDRQDPWGNNYVYARIPNLIGQVNTAGTDIRRDANEKPLNTFYDLYSKGIDGESVSSITFRTSRDDVIRARDGEFIGLASDY